MAEIQLVELCGVRSGDKGDISDITLFADERPVYDALVDAVSAERVRHHFAHHAHGPVDRYLVPNLLAIKFVLHGALGGGSGVSLRSDEQGKTHGLLLLRLRIDLPDSVIAGATRRLHPPTPALPSTPTFH